MNLFKLLASALKMRPDRRVILSNEENFPTDLYMAQGLEWLLDGSVEVRLVPSRQVESALDDSVAVLMLTHVDFRTGEMLEMKQLTEVAHRHGALSLWDLSHSVGAVDVDLNSADVDLAVGCTYKYLCGGPGAPAFAFVAKRLLQEAQSPLWGRFGHDQPFDFDPGFRPARAISRMQCGTPSILGLAALESALEVFEGVEMASVRAKTVAMTELFIDLVDRRCAGFGFELASPRESSRRGSQVSLKHSSGFQIVQALIDRGVIGDFRAPDVLRFGFAPLYLRFEDVWNAVEILRELMETGAWDQPEFEIRGAVT